MLLIGALVGASTVSARGASGTLTSNSYTPYDVCVLTANSTTYALDATVKQATPTTNAGTANTNLISAGNGANDRIYVQFVLSECNRGAGIPATATVYNAILREYVTVLPTNAACRTIDIFPVLSSAPGTVNWSASGTTESTITWNNQPYNGGVNTPTGTPTATYSIGSATGSCTNKATDTYVPSTGTSGAPVVTATTVTPDVASWVAGTTTNDGWMLRDSAECSAACTAQSSTYDSNDITCGTAFTCNPQLIITYKPVP
jgi:hypothetical protein